MKFKKVVIVSVHADDETLGAGGTILKLKNKNVKVYWLQVSNSHGFGGTDSHFKKKDDQIKKINKFYKFNGVFKLNFEAGEIYKVPKDIFINKASAIIKKIKPDTVFINFHKDVHSDHAYTFENFKFMFKSFRYPYIKNILMMEIISETDHGPQVALDAFKPNYFVNINKFIAKKCKAMQIYKTEIMKKPLPRSIDTIKALSRYRGSQCGCEFAEAFMVVKQIED